MIGEQLDVGDEICGVGVSMRYNEDILSVWNKTAGDGEAKKIILQALQRHLPLQTTYIEFKAHDDSLVFSRRKKSSKADGEPDDLTASAGGAADPE